MTENESTDQPAKGRALTEHPVFRWAERLFWLAVFAWIAFRLAPQASALTGVGQDDRPSPPIVVETLDGRTLGDTDLAGQVVVLSFWAT